MDSFLIISFLVVLAGIWVGRAEVALIPLVALPFALRSGAAAHAIQFWMLPAAVVVAWAGAVVRRHQH